MSKFTKIAAGLAVVPVLALSGATAFASSQGQLESGPNVYVVRNVTQNGSYAATANATSCDVVKYSIDLHNADYNKLTNIAVKATLQSGSTTANTSTMTATTPDGATSGITESVTVNANPASTFTYVAGSTQLLDASGNVLKQLPDSITTTGVTVDSLLGSTSEYVNFEAKLNCPTPPPTQIKVCEIATKQIVTINENDFNSSKHTKDLSQCAQTTTPPTTLPNTGAGDVVGLVAGAMVAGFVASRLFLSRKLARKA